MEPNPHLRGALDRNALGPVVCRGDVRDQDKC